MNAQRQYRVLYRHFLFRLMDVEMLAADARGDSSTLFGQFAALLVFVSVVFGWGAVITGGFKMPPEAMLTMGWSIERRMLAMTMLTVGVFAVLNWESTFLDRRDALALAPLPVRVRTLFAAKIAAVGTALGLTVAALNCLSASLWPLALAPDGCGIAGTLRFVAAYWVALAAAGAFYFCAVLGAQGIAAQLPRRWYLRVSPFLQVGAFAVILAVFCLEPTLNTAQALGAPENQRALAWLPSYWFLGLLNELSGAFEAQGHAVMAPLARRAAEGLAIAGCVAGAAFLLSYFRTLRKVVEEPDIAPGARGIAASAVRERAADGAGAVRDSDAGAEPAASRDSGVLSGHRLRRVHGLCGIGFAIGTSRRNGFPETSEPPHDGREHRDAVRVGAGDARGVFPPDRSARQLGLPRDAREGRRGLPGGGAARDAGGFGRARVGRVRRAAAVVLAVAARGRTSSVLRHPRKPSRGCIFVRLS